MSKAIQLTVAEPCHENWDKMSPVQQGRFCGSCQKQVVDFSVMSDRELLQFFQKPSTGSVCGRFMTGQLDRNLEQPAKKISWFRYAWQILLPALLVTKVSAQRTMGKPATRPALDTFRLNEIPHPPVMGMVVRVPDRKPKIDSVIKDIPMIREELIKGKVTDSAGRPVPYASVDPGNGKARPADENGEFVLDGIFIKNGQSIRISSVNYELKTIFIDKEKAIREGIQIKLEPKVALPEVVISCYPEYRKGFVTMGAVSTISRKTEKAEIIPLPEVKSGMHIFPNPISQGQSLTISIDKPEEGYYSALFTSMSGQSMSLKDIWIDAEARVLSIQPPYLSAGVYILTLTNKRTGKKLSEKVVVQ